MTRARIAVAMALMAAVAGCRQPSARENVAGQGAEEPISVESSSLGRMLAEYLDYVLIGTVGASFERGKEGTPGGVHPVRQEFDRAGIRYFVGEGSVMGAELWVPPDRSLEAIEIGRKHSSDPNHFMILRDPGKPTPVLREEIESILRSNRNKKISPLQKQ